MNCKSITASGSRCIKFGYYNGYCKIHCPDAKKKRLKKKIDETSEKLKLLNIKLNNLNQKHSGRKRSRKEFEEDEITEIQFSFDWNLSWDFNDVEIKPPPCKKRRLNPIPTFRFEFPIRNNLYYKK